MMAVSGVRSSWDIPAEEIRLGPVGRVRRLDGKGETVFRALSRRDVAGHHRDPGESAAVVLQGRHLGVVPCLRVPLLSSCSRTARRPARTGPQGTRPGSAPQRLRGNTAKVFPLHSEAAVAPLGGGRRPGGHQDAIAVRHEDRVVHGHEDGAEPFLAFPEVSLHAELLPRGLRLADCPLDHRGRRRKNFS